MIETHSSTEIDATADRPPRRWVRVLLGFICALLAAMWVYGFVFAPKTGVYFVTDKAWRTSADHICASVEQQRLAL
ncbi:MAG TPA: hypothetical protein VGC84_12950, partial [Ilumatobacteraceae bacterium]